VNAHQLQPTDEVVPPPREGEGEDRFTTVTHVRREVFIIYREAKSRKRPVPEAYSLVQILQTGAKLMEQERDARIVELEAKVALLEKLNAAQAQAPLPQGKVDCLPIATAARPN
jgi:hypothetical protein